MMRFRKIIVPTLLLVASPVLAMDEHHSRMYGVMLDHLEFSDSGQHPLSWDAKAWTGDELERFWLKSEGELEDGRLTELAFDARYSRAISPFWDVQAGLRHDARPSPSRNWGVLALHGLAPYFFKVDAAFYLGESGATALRLKAEYDLLFTQRLILSPELKASFYGKSLPESGLGSGLSELGLGLRLRYEIRREFAPYIGVSWKEKYGTTADFARSSGGSSGSTSFLLGLSAWF